MTSGTDFQEAAGATCACSESPNGESNMNSAIKVIFKRAASIVVITLAIASVIDWSLMALHSY
jgi:hypothetical protein